MSRSDAGHLWTWAIKPSREPPVFPEVTLEVRGLKVAESLSAEPWRALWGSPTHPAVFITHWTYIHEKKVYLLCDCSILWCIVPTLMMQYHLLGVWRHWRIVAIVFGFLFSACVVCFLWVLFAINLQLSFTLFFPKYISLIIDHIWERGTKMWVKSYVKFSEYENQMKEVYCSVIFIRVIRWLACFFYLRTVKLTVVGLFCWAGQSPCPDSCLLGLVVSPLRMWNCPF